MSALRAALIWSAVAEFLFLRTFLRLGPVLPADAALLPVYQAVEIAGLAAMNLATLTAVAIAVGLAARLLSERRIGAILVGGLILGAALANTALMLLSAGLPAGAASVLQAGATLAALLAVYAGRARRRRGQLTIGLIAGAYTLALSFYLAQGLAGFGLPLPGSGTLLFAAEAAAVAAAVVLPWSFRPHWHRGEIAVGAGLAAAVLAVHSLRPWVLAAMAVWNLAFSLFLPGAVYAVALGAFAATVLALRREAPAGREATAGLLLIALAGLKLDFSYSSLLALVGFSALAGRSTGAPVPQPAATR